MTSKDDRLSLKYINSIFHADTCLSFEINQEEPGFLKEFHMFLNRDPAY